MNDKMTCALNQQIKLPSNSHHFKQTVQNTDNITSNFLTLSFIFTKQVKLQQFSFYVLFFFLPLYVHCPNNSTATERDCCLPALVQPKAKEEQRM